MPAFTTALSFFDGYRSEIVPANLLQAQRDYFGAHTFLVLPGKENERFVSGDNIRAFSFHLSGSGLVITGLTVGRSLNRHQLDWAWWKCLGRELRRIGQFCHGGRAELDMRTHGKMNEICTESNKVDTLWTLDTVIICPELDELDELNEYG